MSDKDSNKHGAKTTVLFGWLSHQLRKKKGKKEKKKKGERNTLWIRVKLDVVDFTL